MKPALKLVVADSPETADQCIPLRMAKVLSMLPSGVGSRVLEIGARHGVMTRELAKRFDRVTALDLETPQFELERVTTVAGNVESLQFEDGSFDCVVCTEVLEHVPDVAAAARELGRVSRGSVLVGVPYRQDRRVGRTTCSACRRVNPPWGHLHSFDEDRLKGLFSDLRHVSTEYLAENKERTNALSVWLQDFAGNPYGNYYQEEPCIFCGAKILPPAGMSFVQRAACSLGVRLYDFQTRFNEPRPTWIHLLLAKA